MMNRRLFLQLLAAAVPALHYPSRLYAAPGVDSRFLMVFLRGGYDAANILIPHSSPFYYQARPTIAIAKPDATNNKAALALDSDWGLHPVLKDTMGSLFAKGQLAFIPFAGTDDVSRSHFETQDSIELGQPLRGHKDYSSGFLNRLAMVLTGSRSVAFTDNRPLILTGTATVANFSLKNKDKTVITPHQAQILAEMYSQHHLDADVKQGLALSREVTESFEVEMLQANRGAMLAKGFELEARRIARMMQTKFNIGFIDVGGWDTHINQGAAEGSLADKMASLGLGLSAFAAEMGSSWNKTVVLVISEFGRTFRENGNKGTDHGHGSVYWLLGGGIQGGRVVGEQIEMTENNLFQNRDYPVLNEYRSVIAGLFRAQFGLSTADLQKVFSGINPVDLKLL
jgi:uncharacterized protein (DUF1501 family)